MNQIGFIAVGHEDYDVPLLKKISDDAKQNLKSLGYEIYSAKELITNHNQAEKWSKDIAYSGVSGVVVFLASWVECPVVMSVIREIEHLNFCLWGIPMFDSKGELVSTGSYVSFAMFKGTLNRIGYTYSSLIDSINSDEALKQLDLFCRSSICISKLKRSRIGLIGYTSMGIYPGTFDHVFLRYLIGPEVVHTDTYTLINIAEKSSLEEKQDVISKWGERAKINCDIPQEKLLKSAGLYIGLKEIVKQQDLHAINVKCQYELSKEYKAVACVPLALLADECAVASCEGDTLNTVSMLILHYLSGQVVTYGDAMNHNGNVVKFSTCGFLPFSMGDQGRQEISNFMPHPGFSGIQNKFCMRPERVTIMRLIEDKCNYHILYCTGQGLETDLRQNFMPALDVMLDGDVNSLVKEYSGQHFAICYGDFSDYIERFASMLKIRTTKV